MPVRFTTPSLGGQGELQVADLAAHQWNIALGIGVKAPAGTHTATDAYFLKGGTSIQYPVDQSIEPGDGGWGIVLQLQAYRRAFHNAIAYVTGSYLVNPRRLSDVAKDP